MHVFAEKNFVNLHYGSRFNDYMGVGLAIPLNSYEIVKVDCKRMGTPSGCPALPGSIG